MKIYMKKVWLWCVERIKERSTWIGLVSLLTTAGLCISPNLKDAIIEMGISLASIISIVTKD